MWRFVVDMIDTLGVIELTFSVASVLEGWQEAGIGFRDAAVAVVWIDGETLVVGTHVRAYVEILTAPGSDPCQADRAGLI